MHEDLKVWVRAVSGDSTDAQVCAALGVSESTFWRKFQAEVLDANMVLGIAKAFGVNPIPGLVAAGLVTREEAHFEKRDAALSALSDEDLVDELYARHGSRDGAAAWTRRQKKPRSPGPRHDGFARLTE